ncbi:hypothetical protein Bhyg_08468 [Pseudolycoriella hygida]|uniref:Uncharacterized protein n=1 Tax=Pseudolycoriella hygida TaxID=35572 RepID=A0A9Q0N609_9DIPT|nr:hypothetical protein Bhyg_08468 [Pseudolycoriella hygida]
MPKKFIKRPLGVMMARNRKIKDGMITVYNRLLYICKPYLSLPINQMEPKIQLLIFVGLLTLSVQGLENMRWSGMECSLENHYIRDQTSPRKTTCGDYCKNSYSTMNAIIGLCALNDRGFNECKCGMF